MIHRHYVERDEIVDTRQLFLTDLYDVLDKWGASITAEDHYSGYPECGEDIRMTVDIPEVCCFDTGKMLRHRLEINLGCCVDAKILKGQIPDLAVRWASDKDS